MPANIAVIAMLAVIEGIPIMQIQCKLKRSAGTVVELGGTTYHFKPNDKGDHVADVADDDHADTLLAITEGYEAYEQEPATSGDVKATRTRKSANKPADQADGDAGQGE